MDESEPDLNNPVPFDGTLESLEEAVTHKFGSEVEELKWWIDYLEGKVKMLKLMLNRGVEDDELRAGLEENIRVEEENLNRLKTKLSEIGGNSDDVELSG